MLLVGTRLRYLALISTLSVKAVSIGYSGIYMLVSGVICHWEAKKTRGKKPKGFIHLDLNDPAQLTFAMVKALKKE